ncbi:MAG: hypothetical protein M1831_002109 [Alyxoria varia]|nr:MAG: hypothetical protein M1831_002109 [Alyxoria varia]
MAPSAGSPSTQPHDPAMNERSSNHERNGDSITQAEQDESAQASLAARASEPQNFTLRGVLLGLIIGIVVVFSNTYFGLQTGWISGMAMPSALIGFAVFKALESHLKMPFSPVENVLVQSVSGSVGTMPLGCGFVGVIPALEYLLHPDENGPLNISLGRLCLWAVGICLFGVVFAVPLRKEVIIREKLKFPTGTATALMIQVLHGGGEKAKMIKQDHSEQAPRRHSGEEDETQALISQDEEQSHNDARPVRSNDDSRSTATHVSRQRSYASPSADWKSDIRLLVLAFAGSTLYTIITYFIPQLRNLPILGPHMARTWLWTLNPSPAYVGQGIIMGPATTFHMLLGAIVGWGILSPLAKTKGWAPGEVSDWEKGSKGWILWVSLAIMLSDALVSLAWLIVRPLLKHAAPYVTPVLGKLGIGKWRSSKTASRPSHRGYSAVSSTDPSSTPLTETPSNPPGPSTKQRSQKDLDDDNDDIPDADAPPEHLVSTRSTLIMLAISLTLYILSIHLGFPNLMPFHLTLLALVLAVLLSILGVRALGETDLNPVSGISKITQLVFALLVPVHRNPNAVIVNLLAGAVSESGALQAGDLMQDLKTGHLLGAAPAAQFYGQIIGSVVGAAVSACVYRLYARTYVIGEGQFQVPTAYVWVYTARLVTGEGLPRMADVAAFWAAGVYVVLTVARLVGKGRGWKDLVPGGIAVAVGMYNTPNFTFARFIGGALAWWWTRWRGKGETRIVVLASGLILGEGLTSVVNLVLAHFGVPHL